MMPAAVAEDMVGVDDIAAMLDKSPYTIREYARNGDIPAHKIGREWKFFRSEIREHLTSKVLDPWVRKKR